MPIFFSKNSPLGSKIESIKTYKNTYVLEDPQHYPTYLDYFGTWIMLADPYMYSKIVKPNEVPEQYKLAMDILYN